MSACESSVVDPGAPDEALGLPSAMSYAGASAVIGSPWRVDDAATAVLVPCGLLGVLPLHLAWTGAQGTRRLIDELPVVLALSGRHARPTNR